MREIKFRAWDLDNLIMHYSDKEEDNGEGPITWSLEGNRVVFSENQMFDTCPGGVGHVQEFHYHTPNQITMQFTGLKDKNGKEIYEGDIVRYDLGDREAELEGEENRYDYAQIVFDNGQFLTLNHDGSTLDEIVGFGQENQWEVIGNIYENPELLKETE